MIASLVLAGAMAVAAAPTGSPPPEVVPSASSGPFPAAARPDPASNPREWVSDADYPKGQLATGAQGTTDVRLFIDVTGLPVRCDILESSGHAALDSRTCDLLMARGRFIPGRDAQGNLASATFRQSVRWQVPGEPMLSGAIKIAADIDNDGELVACHASVIGIVPEKGLFTPDCTNDLSLGVFTAVLPEPLDSYRSVSVLLLHEVAGDSVPVPRAEGRHQVVMFRLVLDVAGDGVVLACREEIMQRILADALPPGGLCGEVYPVGVRAYGTSADGKPRKLLLAAEISGVPR